MIPVLLEAALRSLFVGVIVAIGLRVFRVRNVIARKAALGLVLAAALAMPFLAPIMARLQLMPGSTSIVVPARAMTLLEELQARIQQKGSGGLLKPGAVPAAAPANPPQANGGAEVAPGPAPSPIAKETARKSRRSSTQVSAQTPSADSGRQGEEIPPASRISRAAFSPWAVALAIYAGIAAVLLLKLSFGLAITLRLWVTATPIDPRELSGACTSLRLRASPRISSPLTIGSGILLPANFDSWDTAKLRIVLAHERSHIRQGDFYLQLLAAFYAALVWFSPLGWWLKRELAELAEAISDRAGIEEAPSRTSYAQILLEFAAAPRPTALGVAMARSGSLTRRIERLLNDHSFRQAFAGGYRPLLAVVLVPLALIAGTTMVQVQAAARNATVASIAPCGGAVCSFSQPDTTARSLNPELPESTTVYAANNSDGMATVQLTADSSEITAVAPAAVAQSDSDNSLSFDRTLTAADGTQLFVNTGSGNIHLTRGSGNQIHIHGQIHVSHEGSEEQARQIASNPPIEQSGNVIKVGQQHEEHWRGISISYQIEAPAGTVLSASTGSGDIVDEGVGQNAKLETGSGNIHASGLQGKFVVETGSGDIVAEQIGEGDVKAETGSGNIEIKDVHGSFQAETGSGDIRAHGTPSAPWKLESGSGNIEIWTGKAPLTLDASTGSGSVNSDSEMMVQGSLDHHHIKGNLNGGGPLVRAETGSGDIRVH